jgi:acyl-CoA hydrolase
MKTDEPKAAPRGIDTFTIVRPEHLNHHGSLFGGQLLTWVDEFAWIVASREYAGFRLVTRAMDEVQFRTPVSSPRSCASTSEEPARDIRP